MSSEKKCVIILPSVRICEIGLKSLQNGKWEIVLHKTEWNATNQTNLTAFGNISHVLECCFLGVCCIILP